MISRNSKGLLLGLLSTLIWGCQYSAARAIFGSQAEEIDPYLMSLMKFASAAVALLPFLCFDNGWRKTAQAMKCDWLQMILLGVLGVAAEGLLAFYSLKYTTSARSSLLCNMSPVFTVLLAMLFTRKMPDWGKWVGVVLGFVGLALVLNSQSSDIYDAKPFTLPGDVMALASGVAWAFFTVAGVKCSQKYGGIPCTVVTLTVAAVAMVVVCLVTGTDFMPQLTLKSLALVLFLGIMATGIGVGLWNLAMGLTDPSALGAFGYLSSLIALCLARFVSKEHFTWQFFLAFALIMSAIYFMNRGTSDKTEN
ncbi:MAG: DMT family transporter [Lentisphaeria bacterium]|nr:DMT family transporter [Lentisphaeria bacterium]